MRNLKQQLSVALIQLVLLGSFSIASAQSSDGMRWSVTPYIKVRWPGSTSVSELTPAIRRACGSQPGCLVPPDYPSRLIWFSFFKANPVLPFD